MQGEVSVRAGSYRWVIVSLLFAATMVNYYDRIVLSVLIPRIKQDMGVTDIQYSWMLSLFQFGYMFGSLAAGKVIDRLGVRTGYLLSIFLWSLAGTMHGVARSAFSLGIWRGLLGITEAGNFPAAIKGVSEWFHRSERAFATALFNSGPHMAMITGAPLIFLITSSLGWRWAFVILGLTGIGLSAVWPLLYRKPPHAPDESESAGRFEGPVRWRDLLRRRETYGIMLARSLTDPVWWFYIFWLPNYLNSQRGFDLKQVAVAFPLIYTAAILFGNAAGLFSGALVRRGMDASRARKLTMLLCALCMPFTAFAVAAENVWTAVALASLACGAHTGWAANVFALITDRFPSRAVGSVTGISTFAGGLGGLLLSTFTVGYMVTYFGYLPVFILMGILHPAGFLFLHFMVRDKQTA